MKKTKWIFAIVALCMVAVFVFAGCDNAAAGGSKPTGKDDGNPPPVSDDPRNAVLGTYNNVIIDGAEYTLTFYEGGFGIKKASSGNMRSVMPDVSDVGDYFIWSLSGDTVIIRFVSSPNSFTLDFSNSGGTKKLSNLQGVPAATYELDKVSKTLTFKGAGEINYRRCFSGLDVNEEEELRKVEKIVIRDGVTIIGFDAIHLENLKSVTIPDSVAVIYEGAFQACLSLTSVTIPDNTDVFGGAFWGCLELRNIIVGSGHKYFTAENGVLYNKDKTKIITWPAASGTVSIPSTVTDIGYYAFFGSMSLTSITIPNTVKEIGYGVFTQCWGLSSVTIPNSVTSIGPSAFTECRELTSVIIPESVREIGDRAFVQCLKLSSITVKATTPPKLGTAVIPDGELVFPDDTKIYVPSASVSAYKTAAGWSEYAGVIEPQ